MCARICIHADKEISIQNILNYITPYDWYSLGENLNLPRGKLEEIKSRPHNDQKAHFVEFMYNQIPTLTWSSLKQALSPELTHRPYHISTIPVPRDFNIVKSDIWRLDSHFTSLMQKVEKKLDKEKKDVADVFNMMKYLPPRLKEVYSQSIKREYKSLDKSESHGELFIKLNDFWNFLDFQLLECIIERHCNEDQELKSALQKYREDLQAFCKSTTVSQLIEIWRPLYAETEITEYESVVARLNFDPKHCSVFSLDSLREKMRGRKSYSTLGKLSLTKTAFILWRIEAGSVTVIWLVGEEVRGHLFQLIKSHTGFVDQYQITFLSVDEYIVHSVGKVHTIAKMEHHPSVHSYRL